MWSQPPHPRQQLQIASVGDVFMLPGFLDIWISGYLDFWISGFLDFWISGYP